MSDTIQIDKIEHDIARDEVIEELDQIEDMEMMVSRAHGMISGAVMAMLPVFELSSILGMLNQIAETATEASSGMVEQ